MAYQCNLVMGDVTSRNCTVSQFLTETFHKVLLVNQSVEAEYKTSGSIVNSLDLESCLPMDAQLSQSLFLFILEIWGTHQKRPV